ncbi:MAG TPA: ketopantoate reductase C-terminal domain-containing protein, partial [Thermomicrobiales bacterium]|nr:ketopantoate reductase C-terminal domain-containing protein [Thermomicrobiales bacterium]
TADVKTEVWKKLVLNCATLPTAALTHLTSGDLDQPAPMRDLIDELAREAVAVGRAAGRPVDPEERIAAIHAVLGRAGKGKASMLQDVEAQRPTEIDAINGAVLREADRLGIRVPNNQAMFGLIKGLERSWQGD